MPITTETTIANTPRLPHGKLAAQCGFNLPVSVLQSQAGFYLGTANELGPVSRESMEYYRKRADADQALANGSWTQREQS